MDFGDEPTNSAAKKSSRQRAATDELRKRSALCCDLGVRELANFDAVDELRKRSALCCDLGVLRRGLHGSPAPSTPRRRAAATSACSVAGFMLLRRAPARLQVTFVRLVTALGISRSRVAQHVHCARSRAMGLLYRASKRSSRSPRATRSFSRRLMSKGRCASRYRGGADVAQGRTFAA